MPIYDYRCDHCGHVFSAVQAYSDATLEICPNCGKKPRKLLTAPAGVFKGSGWYKTDSRGSAPKEGDSAAPAKDSATPAKKDEAKKDDAKKSDAPAPSSNASTKSEASS